MNKEHCIFAIDDAESARRILEAAFGTSYEIETFESGEQCLERLNSKIPDLFLFDVELPGIDGYALCKKIREQAQFAGIPGIFISARDDLESRLQGYDAGGIDFIVKPYKMAELKQKVELAIATASSHSAMQRRLDDSDLLTSLVLSNLDEYALLIKFLRSLNSVDSVRAVAEAVLEMLAGFRLEGAVQLRLADQELTLSPQGENTPLEVSVIQHVKTLGSVFEFKNRAVFNFPHITVLINAMPAHDPDLCGRLRDHLAIAAESANARLETLQTRQEKARTGNQIGEVLASITGTVSEISRKYDAARYQGTLLTQAMLDELARAFAYLGLSDQQEDRIQEIIRSKAEALAAAYDFGEETRHLLEKVAERLQGVCGGR